MSCKPHSSAFPLISMAIFFVSITSSSSSPQCWYILLLTPQTISLLCLHLFLDDLIQIYGFMYHLYTDNSQIYNPSLDISAELQVHTPKHLLNNFPRTSNRHLKLNTSKRELLIFPLKHAPPEVFPISMHIYSMLTGASAKIFYSLIPHIQSVSTLCCHHLSRNYFLFPYKLLLSLI